MQNTPTPQYVDDLTRGSWKEFEDSIGSVPRVVIRPDVYLKHVEAPSPLEGYTQDTLDRGIEAAVSVYTDAFLAAFNQHAMPVTVERKRYIPVSAYGKGGPISAAYELLHFLVDNEYAIGVASGLLVDILGQAVWNGGREFMGLLRRLKYTPSELELPSHDPFLVSAACEAHAREQYGPLKLGRASIHAAFPASADLPIAGNLYTVAVPYRNGSIIYVIDDRLHLMHHLRVNSKGSEPLDPDSWWSKFRSMPT